MSGRSFPIVLSSLLAACSSSDFYGALLLAPSSIPISHAKRKKSFCEKFFRSPWKWGGKREKVQGRHSENSIIFKQANNWSQTCCLTGRAAKLCLVMVFFWCVCRCTNKIPFIYTFRYHIWLHDINCTFKCIRLCKLNWTFCRCISMMHPAWYVSAMN